MRFRRRTGRCGCQLAACNDHVVLLSLLYVIVRCLLGVPVVLLRRDLETLASTTDEEIESARRALYQIASVREP